VITGEELTWTLTAKNNGPPTRPTLRCRSAAARDELSELQTSQGKACVYIAPGSPAISKTRQRASATVAVTARVTAPPGSLTNTATVEGEQTDPDLENNKASRRRRFWKLRR